MEIEALKTAQLVATHGSFAAAARVLDVDPSSVSRTVAGLEADLGLRLFQRTTRQVRLTEAGAQYLSRIAPLLDDLDMAREDAVRGAAHPQGRVRLTASVAFGHEVLVPLLTDLRVALPEITFEMILSDDTVDLIAAGVDVAVRLAPAPKGDLISTRLMDTRYCVVASPGWIARHGKPMRPDDLARHDCLRLTLPEYRTEWRFRGASMTTVPVDGPILMSNALALRAAARAGHGPALLADWMTNGDIADGRLVDLFPDHQATATDFDTAAWVLYPSRSYLPARVRAVIDALKGMIRGSRNR